MDNFLKELQDEITDPVLKVFNNMQEKIKDDWLSIKRNSDRGFLINGSHFNNITIKLKFVDDVGPGVTTTRKVMEAKDNSQDAFSLIVIYIPSEYVRNQEVLYKNHVLHAIFKELYYYFVEAILLTSQSRYSNMDSNFFLPEYVQTVWNNLGLSLAHTCVQRVNGWSQEEYFENVFVTAEPGFFRKLKEVPDSVMGRFVLSELINKRLHRHDDDNMPTERWVNHLKEIVKKFDLDDVPHEIFNFGLNQDMMSHRELSSLSLFIGVLWATSIAFCRDVINELSENTIKPEYIKSVDVPRKSREFLFALAREDKDVLRGFDSSIKDAVRHHKDHNTGSYWLLGKH